MDIEFSEEKYNEMIEKLFQRFPSFQLVGTAAYNPGLDKIMMFDRFVGHPHRKFQVIHVAGTNGKGSVSSMLASVLSANGLRVGLFTSPHILDFRERARIIERDSVIYISKDFIWDFNVRWHKEFDHLDLSLFEISTMMAFKWFESEAVDVAVVETGLGGRLDSTNIVEPVLSIITNIGLDHCNILGNTMQEIAYEKAGIIKPCVPIVVGESNPETDDVFRRKVLYTNLSEQRYMGNKESIMSLLTFADKVAPSNAKKMDEILEKMDLRGEYQKINLRTALVALDLLTQTFKDRHIDVSPITETAKRTDFHGRWEQISQTPCVICDIAHNDHGLRPNMLKLSGMLSSGEIDSLVIVFGIMSDKELEKIVPILPSSAEYIFTSALGPRAMKAEVLASRYVDCCTKHNLPIAAFSIEQDTESAFCKAKSIADSKVNPLIYIGGSTSVVAEIIRISKDRL